MALGRCPLGIFCSGETPPIYHLGTKRASKPSKACVCTRSASAVTSAAVRTSPARARASCACAVAGIHTMSYAGLVHPKIGRVRDHVCTTEGLKINRVMQVDF